jgi:F-type H+-transporting ATPase subunit b
MEQVHNLMEQFGFAWPKFIAQIILFLVVYGILSRFAFGPIIKILEERRRRIEEGQANAEKIKRQLAEAERRYQEIVQKASAEAQTIVDEARKSGEAIVQKQSQEAVHQAQEIIEKAHASIEIERHRMEDEVRSQMIGLVVNTTRKVTGKVLTKDDQERLNEETVRQLAA